MNERDADRLADKARRQNQTRRFVKAMDMEAGSLL